MTKKEQLEIDQKTKKSREEFSKGFVKGASFSLAAYFLYSTATSAAYAADSKIPKTGPTTPGDTAAVQPGPATKPAKPGFKPLPEPARGAFIGASSAICAAALQSGDFYLGLSCGFLVIVGHILINRPQP